VSLLKSENQTNADIYDELVWRLSSYAFKIGKSKANIKRDLIRMGIISK
jgi:hypothetical protein